MWRASKDDYAGVPCSICSAPADGMHYGAISCRSCNAFFRRAVTFNQRYDCRFNGDCDVSQQVRCACRACRFNKCLQSGMRIASVQPRRDPTGSQKERKRQSVSGGSAAAFVKEEAEDTAEELPSTSGDGDHAPFANEEDDYDELEKFVRLAQQFKEHHRQMQVTMTLIQDFVEEHDSGIKFRVMEPGDVQLLSTTELGGLLYWMEKQHPYKSLPIDDRRALLKRYSVRKLSLDHMYIASLHKEHIRLGQFVMLNNTFVPPGQTGFEAATDDERLREAKARILLPTFERMWRCVVAPFAAMKITNAEMVFLHSNLLWSHLNEPHVCKPTRDILKARREWASERLQEYYESVGQREPEVRFGEVVLLLGEIEGICESHCQDYAVARVFQFCDMSAFWYEQWCYSTVNTNAAEALKEEEEKAKTHCVEGVHCKVPNQMSNEPTMPGSSDSQLAEETECSPFGRNADTTPRDPQDYPRLPSIPDSSQCPSL